MERRRTLGVVGKADEKPTEPFFPELTQGSYDANGNEIASSDRSRTALYRIYDGVLLQCYAPDLTSASNWMNVHVYDSNKKQVSTATWVKEKKLTPQDGTYFATSVWRDRVVKITYL